MLCILYVGLSFLNQFFYDASYINKFVVTQVIEMKILEVVEQSFLCALCSNKHEKIL